MISQFHLFPESINLLFKKRALLHFLQDTSLSSMHFFLFPDISGTFLVFQLPSWLPKRQMHRCLSCSEKEYNFSKTLKNEAEISFCLFFQKMYILHWSPALKIWFQEKYNWIDQYYYNYLHKYFSFKGMYCHYACSCKIL